MVKIKITEKTGGRVMSILMGLMILLIGGYVAYRWTGEKQLLFWGIMISGGFIALFFIAGGIWAKETEEKIIDVISYEIMRDKEIQEKVDKEVEETIELLENGKTEEDNSRDEEDLQK